MVYEPGIVVRRENRVWPGPKEWAIVDRGWIHWERLTVTAVTQLEFIIKHFKQQHERQGP